MAKMILHVRGGSLHRMGMQADMQNHVDKMEPMELEVPTEQPLFSSRQKLLAQARWPVTHSEPQLAHATSKTAQTLKDRCTAQKLKDQCTVAGVKDLNNWWSK